MEDQNNALFEAIQVLCERLAERKAVLFLGAGVNGGIKNQDDIRFPLGQSLSDWIANDILGYEDNTLPLTETSEMARHKVGNSELNNYLSSKFDSFKPGLAHLSLVQVPWDAMYTTNYDLLVEKAAEYSSVRAAGKIQQIFSADKDVKFLEESDIPYYKIHGSIDYANSSEGRLILTKEDYRYYELHRKPLFRRLLSDLFSRCFLFVGYSLSDDNFRSILDDCLNQIGRESLPLSFAVMRSFNSAQELYWRDKYNIQLIKSDSDTFLDLLKTTWFAEEKIVTPLAQRVAKEYLEISDGVQFPKVAESFYKLEPMLCNGLSNAARFFKGGEPTWNDISNKVMPEREMYWAISESIFSELVDPLKSPSIYLVTGSAGTGKTTLIYSLSYSIAKDYEHPVLIHIPGTPLDVRYLGTLIDRDNPKRIIIVIRHAAELIRELDTFINDLRQNKLPVTIILEERKNQWSSVSGLIKRFSVLEFELSSLTRQEITGILLALDKAKSLGKLTGMPQEYQVEHFEALAHKDLLVALRELTSGTSFDNIVRDEFDKIPGAIAKEAYVYVSTFGQIDLPVRYETVMNLLGINFSELSSTVFRPTEGILLTTEQSGRTRHDIGYRLSTRHPIIASIIFDLAAPTDEAKLDILNKFMAVVDPGRSEDRRLLETMARKRALVSTLESAENRRAIYLQLERLLPNDEFVLQHRSILERELNDAELAVQYAKKALQINGRRQPSLVNTLGLALELEARNTSILHKRQSLLTEANRCFEEGISKNPSDPYGYLGKYQVLKLELSNEQDRKQRGVIQGNIWSLLEDAFELTDNSEVIANIYSQEQVKSGDLEPAIALLQEALSKEPTNHRVRDRLVQYMSQKTPKIALDIAIAGAKLDASAWRLQAHVARLLFQTGGSTNSIKGHYEAAIRYNKGNLGLQVEYGMYLFKSGQYNDSMQQFSKTAQLSVSSAKKHEIIKVWRDDRGRDLWFDGKIKEIGGAMATVIAIPQNFEVGLWRNNFNSNSLRLGQKLRFSVGFNAYGPTAKSVSF